MTTAFSQHSLAGFYRAPVTKGLLTVVCVGSCSLHVPPGTYRSFAANNAFTSRQLPILKFIAHHLAFWEIKDLLCGALLLYYFRIFERRFGSQKYASYLFATCTMSIMLHYGLLAAANQFEIDIGTMPTGPYGMIFSVFIPYLLDIPRVAYTQVFGIPVTGKTLTYLIGLQMVTSSKEAVLAGVCGLVAGFLYRLNFLYIPFLLRVPDILANASSRTLGYIFQSAAPDSGGMPMGATIEIQRQQHLEQLEMQMMYSQQQRHRWSRGWFNTRPENRHHMGQGYAERLVMPGGQMGQFMNNQEIRFRAPSGPNHIQAATEDQVQQLVDMGFQREDVLNALRQANNDVNIATTILLQDG